jgi:hypothetical protein
MRRPTLIMIIVLVALIGAAGVAQLIIAGGSGDPLPGPSSPGQMPSPGSSVGVTPGTG